MFTIIQVCLVLCGIGIILSRCEEQYMAAKLLNFEFTSNPDLVTFESSVGTTIINGSRTTTFNFVGDLIVEIPCDATIEITFSGKMKDVFTEPFFRRAAKFQNVLNDYQNLTLGHGIQAIRKCVTPYITCPMIKGVHKGTDCTILSSKENNFFMSKTWNATVSVILPDGVEIFSYWFIFEFDDTNILRAKRPTAAQRARKQKGK